jgi:hypothetical protein
MLQRGVRETPVNTVMDTDYDLVNPEQYRIKQ